MNEEFNEYSQEQLKDAHRVAYLVVGYIRNTLTEAEKDELDEWVTASDENMRLFAELTNDKNIEKGLKERGVYDADKAVERLKVRLGHRTETKVKKLRISNLGIAACLILLVGLFLAFALFTKKKRDPAPSVAQTDLLPGTNRAILSLSGGKQIILDSTASTIIRQEGLSVVNEKGALSYKGNAGELEYHTLTTPKGGQYQLLLEDGTRVWLNAASSIHFPTAFTSPERKVEITGEAYFEVAHDASKPFHVSVDGMDVQVLGTHFNVNAYEDEEGIKTTLLEGSVKVSNASGSEIIQPGEQAVVSKESKPSVVKNIDLEEAVAWKNGVFEFHDEPIENIMRQVARWYDVTVKYERKPVYHFNATVERNVPVSKLLHFLELTGKVHFTLQDKVIIVKP